MGTWQWVFLTSQYILLELWQVRKYIEHSRGYKPLIALIIKSIIWQITVIHNYYACILYRKKYIPHFICGDLDSARESVLTFYGSEVCIGT